MTKKIEIEKIYPLTSMQEGMLFHSLGGRELDFYFVQNELSIQGDLDRALLEKSFSLVLQKHEALRALFVYDKLSSARQIVRKNTDLKIHFEDLAPLDGEEKRRHIDRFKREEKERGFDLARDWLIRVALFRLDKELHKVVFSFHHIIIDGWCIGIIFKELMQNYHALKRGESVMVESSSLYGNYFKWLAKQDKQEGLAYWRNYLEGYNRQATLPKAVRNIEADRYDLQEYEFFVDEELTKKLEKIARDNRVTLNTVLQSVWGILLQKYNNADDVVFGAVVSGRPPELESVEDVVGLFINTIPVRIRASIDTDDFPRLLAGVHRQAASSKPFEYLSLAEIQANSELKGRLIDHLVAYENFPRKEKIKEVQEAGEVAFQIKNVKVLEQTHYHFTVIISAGRRVLVRFNYNGLVYGEEGVKKMARHFLEIVEQVVEDSGVKLGDITLSHDFLDARTDMLRDDDDDWIPG